MTEEKTTDIEVTLKRETIKVVLLAGGVGGSKMANGFAQILPPENLTIVVNTGDDFIHLGLNISPDIDTMLYTLAGVNNLATGWGRSGETWQTFAALKDLGAPTWFQLGDKDIALDLVRTHWVRQGYPLSWITAKLCERFQIKPTILPMTDSEVRTYVETDQGKLDFQDYFVRRRCEPVVREIDYHGAEEAENNRDVLRVIREADLIVFAPSNPMFSLDPILALPGMRRVISAAKSPKVAVSNIIGGQAVKGPAAKLMQELGMEVSPFGVASHLRQLLTGFVLDTVDQLHQLRIYNLGLETLITNTLMTRRKEQAQLAEEIVAFALAELID